MRGVLALDLANRVGWAHSPGDGKAVFGAKSLPHEAPEPGQLYHVFAEWLADQITVLQPRVVVYEAPWNGPHTHQDTAMRLFGLASVTELVVWRREALCRMVDVQTIRRHFLGGNPRRKDAKKAVMAECRRRGFQVARDDEADALALLDFALLKYKLPGLPTALEAAE